MEIIKASLMAAAGGGKSANLQHNPTLTTNDVHHPLQGYDGFDYVTVDVPEQPRPVITETGFTENGRYEAADYGVDAWSVVTVDVYFKSDDPEQLTAGAGTEPVIDLNTEYALKVVLRPATSAGRSEYVVQLYDTNNPSQTVEEYGVGSFPTGQADQWKFKGIRIIPGATYATWTTYLQTPSGSMATPITGTSQYLNQYYSGVDGYGVKNTN